MASDTIGIAIIGIASLIILVTLINGLFPDIYTAARSIASTADSASDRISTSALVTNHYIAGPGLIELDILNNGKGILAESTINMSVLNLGNESMPSNMLSLGDSGAGQYWNYTNIGRDSGGDTDGNWDPGETLVVSVVSPDYGFAPGEYQLKMIMYNNALCQYRFSV